MKKQWLICAAILLCMAGVAGCKKDNSDIITETYDRNGVEDSTEISEEETTEEEVQATKASAQTTEDLSISGIDEQSQNNISEYEAEAVEIDFQVETSNDDTQEYGTLTVKSKGKTLWTYETGHYEAGELSMVQCLDSPDNSVYVLENGTIIAFDRETGKEKWRNGDFQGGSAASIVDEKGTLYVCGYYGPDLYIIGTDGTTLDRVDQFSEDFYCPCELEWVDGQLGIWYESSEDTYLLVNPSDLTYTVAE